MREIKWGALIDRVLVPLPGCAQLKLAAGVTECLSRRSKELIFSTWKLIG